MSLRHGLLDLLAGEPMSGYDLSRYYAASMTNVWPARHSQIYPELAKMVADGVIAQTGQGARGRKVYQTTPAGLDELRTWLTDSVPDYTSRNEPLLRVFAMWVLPAEQALALLARDRVEYVRHLGYIDEIIARKDWAASPVQRASRIAIEYGRRFYATQIDWIDWAAEQLAAGTLQPGGPLP